MTKQPPVVRAVGDRIVFIDVARALGALLVVYSNFSMIWLPARHSAPPWMTPLDLVGRYALRLEGQDIGQIAVPMFFLVSGFVVTAVGLTQGAHRFGLKRLLRVYPVLIVAVLIAVVSVSAGLRPLAIDTPPPTGPGTILANVSLANFLLLPTPGLVGVAWTLVVEVLFYLLLLAVMPLFRWRAWYAICVELTAVTVVLAAARAFGAGFLLFAGFVSFLPIILIGQILWAVRARQVDPRAGVGLGALAWLLGVEADRLGLAHHDRATELALAYAVLLFGIGILAESRLRPRKWITYLSDRSYEIYLLHGIVLFPVIDLLTRWLPFRAALPISVLITVGVVETVYRLIDRPARQLGALLTNRLPDPPPTGPAAEITLPRTTRPHVPLRPVER